MKTKSEIKGIARRYLKVIEWSDEDNCFIGSAPPIIGQACHGKTETEVLKQLNTIVEELVETLIRDGHPLPSPNSKKRYSGKFVARVSPQLHRKAALKAEARGVSLNQFVAQALEMA